MLVLLPTTEGHGLSIKTVEAMSTGLPLVATSLAFRGMEINPAHLCNVFIADDPAEFATAVRTATKWRGDPRMSDTREFYLKNFSPEGYAARLGEIACKLIAEEKRTRDVLAPS